jgi:hypothetical protein
LKQDELQTPCDLLHGNEDHGTVLYKQEKEDIELVKGELGGNSKDAVTQFDAAFFERHDQAIITNLFDQQATLRATSNNRQRSTSQAKFASRLKEKGLLACRHECPYLVSKDTRYGTQETKAGIAEVVGGLDEPFIDHKAPRDPSIAAQAGLIPKTPADGGLDAELQQANSRPVEDIDEGHLPADCITAGGRFVSIALNSNTRVPQDPEHDFIVVDEIEQCEKVDMERVRPKRTSRLGKLMLDAMVILPETVARGLRLRRVNRYIEGRVDLALVKEKRIGGGS